MLRCSPDGLAITEEVLEFNYFDLEAAGKIQERRGCTIAKAKEIYKKHVQALANPDIENRAELVLESIERGVEVASDEEVEETVTKAKKVKAKKEPKAKKEKAPKAAKKSKEKKPSKSANPRVDHPFAKPEREVELTPTETPNVYTALLFGRKAAVIWHQVNYERGVEARGQWLQLSQKRLDAAQEFAKANDLPVAICATIRIKGKLDQGYAVPLATFDKFKMKKHNGMVMNGAARKAYSEDGWDGVKFSEAKASEKAA
jgi:hypothetical protein